MTNISELKTLIADILRSADLVDSHIDLLTDDKSMIEFKKAFTHVSVDPINNYEFYEILGDSTTNKVVVWYFVRRFPTTFTDAAGKKGNMGPVAIMARLKQNGVSKTTYSRFASTLGFWPLISRSADEEKNRTSILEDVFESFCGCLELLVDTRINDHVGYAVVYAIMKNLMDTVDISLDHDKLYDSKTRLNEKISETRKRLTLEYAVYDDQSVKTSLDPTAYSRRFTVTVNIRDTKTGKVYKSQPFQAANKKSAEQEAAKYVLNSRLIDRIVAT